MFGRVAREKAFEVIFYLFGDFVNAKGVGIKDFGTIDAFCVGIGC